MSLPHPLQYQNHCNPPYPQSQAPQKSLFHQTFHPGHLQSYLQDVSPKTGCFCNQQVGLLDWRFQLLHHSLIILITLQVLMLDCNPAVSQHLRNPCPCHIIEQVMILSHQFFTLTMFLLKMVASTKHHFLYLLPPLAPIHHLLCCLLIGDLILNLSQEAFSSLLFHFPLPIHLHLETIHHMTNWLHLEQEKTLLMTD